MLFAPKMKLDRSEHTPIMFDDYNEHSYYYVINNNKNQIYSVDEIHEILIKDKTDPFTRLPIQTYKLVRVRLNQ